jgi:CBS-domain-containing membrane protein
MTALVDRLQQRAGPLGAGLYAAVLGLVVLAGCGAIGLATQQPWLFPSLGPTVMLAFESGRQPTARPQNALTGHLVGIAVGAALLHAFGLAGFPPAPVGGLTTGYVAAGALSVALTSLLLLLIRLPHPPAGASTLIVSLGILSTGTELMTMAAAVLLITVACWGVNLLLGLRPEPDREPPSADATAADDD